MEKGPDHVEWLEKARALALASPEEGGSPYPSSKVGAIILDAKGREIMRGVNRLPRGLDWRKDGYNGEETRSLWYNCAEQLVILNALRKKADLDGARMYVTLDPCAVCAGLIIEAGIKEVVIPAQARAFYPTLSDKWTSSMEIGAAKLAEAGVKMTKVKMGKSA